MILNTEQLIWIAIIALIATMPSLYMYYRRLIGQNGESKRELTYENTGMRLANAAMARQLAEVQQLNDDMVSKIRLLEAILRDYEDRLIRANLWPEGYKRWGQK